MTPVAALFLLLPICAGLAAVIAVALRRSSAARPGPPPEDEGGGGGSVRRRPLPPRDPSNPSDPPWWPRFEPPGGVRGRDPAAAVGRPVVRLREIARLVRVARLAAPYGVRALDRCVSIDDLAGLARRRLPTGARAYLAGGGEDEYTLRRNRAAFDELEPRVLEDVSDVDTGTTVLGSRVPLPIALSPVGAPRMFHHEGELAAARAAGHAGVPYGVSTLGTVAVEALAAATAAPLWLQLYVWRDRVGVLLITFALGVTVGAVYEMYEWFDDNVFGAGLHVGYADTIADLFDDALASLGGAALLVRWATRGWGTTRRLPARRLRARERTAG